MTVSTNPVVTGIPTSPVVYNENVTTNGNVTGISASSDGIESTTVNDNPLVTGHFENRNDRQALTNLLGDALTVADYDASLGITGTLNASAWANQIGAAPSLAQATGANQPIVLPYTGEKYAWNGAVAGNNITTPSKTITGNMTLTYDVALDAYPPAVGYEFPSKRTVNNGFRLTYQSNGILLFRVGNGAGENGASATAAYTATAGSRHTFTVNWLDNTSVEFLADGVRIGNVVPLAVVMTNGATPFIAMDASLAGKVYRCTLTNGGATTYYDMNPADSAETSTNGATFVSGGDTYTLNNTGTTPAQIVGSASLLADGTAHKMATANFTLNQPCTEYIVAKQVTWTAGDYLASGTAGVAGIASTTATPSISLNAGAAAAENAGATLGAYHALTATFNGATSALGVDASAETTGNAGAGNPGGLSLFSDNLGANYGNWQVKEMIVRNVADSAATKAKIQAALKAIHRTP